MKTVFPLRLASYWFVGFCLTLLGCTPDVRAAWQMMGIGYTYSQQLGSYPEEYAYAPLTLATDVTAVAAGNFNTVYLKSDGTLWFVGSWNTGEATASEPVLMASGVTRFAVGINHLLWTDASGSLWARGKNDNGQLGDGTTVDRDSPVRVAEGVARVAAGNGFSLFLKNDGGLWGMGRNIYGALGDGSGENRSTPVPIASEVNDLTAGYQHSLFIKADGTLWSTGQNFGGQLGDGTRDTRLSPVQVASGVRLAAGGNGHSLFVKTDGSLWAMGDNAYGQLGDGTLERRTSPVRIAEGVIAAAAGVNHSLFLRADHSLWTMGVTPWEKSPEGGATIRSTPTRVESWVHGIAAGGYHSLFLQTPLPVISTSATVVLAGQTVTLSLSSPPPGVTWTYQWYRGAKGDDSQPVVGATSAVFITPPLAGEASFWARIHDLSGPAETAAVALVGCSTPTITAQPATVVVRAGDTTGLEIVATGGALAYQWYQGASGDVSKPVPGATGPHLRTLPLWAGASFWVRASNLAGAADSTAAIVTVAPGGAFDLVATGSGHGLSPTFILGGVAQIAAGYEHTHLLKSDGTLWAFGDNAYVQLGDGTNTDRLSPTLIASNVVSVTAGFRTGLFLKSDATLWQTGVNSTPKQVATGVATMAAGRAHVLFVKTDGSLWGYGKNDQGQLGDGTGIDRTAPVFIAKDVRRVAAGADHSLFVKTDGTLWANGTIAYRVPVQVATDVTEISASCAQGGHSLFLKTDGTLWGMGAGSNGQLGLGSSASSSVPVQIAAGVARASAGAYHSFFVKTDGSAWSTGFNEYGQLGDGTQIQRYSPVQVAGNVVDVAAGGFHSLLLQVPPPVVTQEPADAVIAPGQAATFTVGAQSLTPLSYQWYRGTDGTPAELIVGATSASYTTPALAGSMSYRVRVTNATGSVYSRVAVAVLPPAILTQPAGVSVAPGRNAFLKVSASGGALAYQWYLGEVGDTSQPVAGATATVLVVVAPSSDQRLWVRVTNAADTVSSDQVTISVAPEVGRNLKMMGNRDYNAFSNDALLPVPISLDVTRPAAGGNPRVHHLFVKADHTLWAMGNNASGQLGDGTTTSRTSPVQIAETAAQVTAGSEHSLFVKRDGTLWGMGANDDGQLGDGPDYRNRLSPVRIASAVMQASAGHAHSLFVKTDGTLWAMGSNANGQLGDGTTTARTRPVQVATGVAQAWAGGSATSLFLKRDGTLWGMGANDSGQLGDGTTTARSVPVLIASDVLTASCGAQHILFLKPDGALWALGANGAGQLGDGTTVGQKTPVMIATGVIEIAAGGGHSLFLKTDGTVWSMGGNSRGQLGDGTTVSRSTPVQVGAHAWGISAGNTHSLFLQTPPPRIVTQPASPVVIPSGTATTLTVTATDNESFTYQWYTGYHGNIANPIVGATGPAFTTPTLAAAQFYWVRLTNSVDFVDSTTAEVYVVTPPAFLTQPSSVTVNHGATATLVTMADGQFVSYQWYAGASGDASAPMTDATNRQFTTPPLDQTRSYWVRATNAAGSTDSVAALVSVRPAVTTQPATTSVLLGENVTLTVVAGGSSPLSYQWYRGTRGDIGQPVAGETGTTLTLLAPAETTSYWIRVTNAVGTADSVAAEVVGMVAPSFTVQPAPIGGGVAFAGPGIARVGVAGGGMSYQWYRGETGDTSSPVVGATSALLLTPPLVADGTFWVRAWNTLGTVDSDPITIPVAPAVPLALRVAGANASGQLGLGTTTTQSTPVRLTLDVVQIAAGYNFSLFVKADGTLWGMGYGSQGQLGGSAFYQLTPVQIATDVAAVAAGREHALFLKRDGSLWSTGSNTYGQRGIGNISGPSTPMLVTTGVARIATGNYHSLFIKTDGTLWAMGSNADGAIGAPETYTRYTPVQVATDVIQATAGSNHSLFVTSDGRAWGMGHNGYGQLGDGTNTFRRTPVALTSGVASVAAGTYHSLFLKIDDTLWASGYNYPGALGDGTTVSRNLPVQIATNVAMATGDRNLGSDIGFSLFVKRDGTLWATGANAYGQLCDGTTASRTTPMQVASGVTAAATGGGHTLFTQTPPPKIIGQSSAVGILAGGSATLQVEARSELAMTYQWYAGASGDSAQPVAGATAATFTTPALGATTLYWVRVTNVFGATDSTTMIATVCTTPTVAVSTPGLPVLASQRTSLMATAGGGLLSYQWYRGASGDVSAPVAGATGEVLTTPPLTESTPFWVRVSNVAGTTDSAATPVTVIPRANLMTTGDNSHAQLGLGFGGGVTPAVSVTGGVAKIAGGALHTLILKADGTLWAVGRNSFGQLGDGTTTDRLTPVQIATGVVEIAAGAWHSLYVKGDGTLWSVGGNGNGQLGNGNTTSRSTQVQIATGVKDVAAGSSHTLFLKTDGRLYACGANASGQLGNDGTTDRSLPVQVATGVTRIAAGSSHSLALKTDGSLWATGLNSYGQLGDGTLITKTVFTPIAMGVAQVAAGGNCTWFVKTDGTLWTVGYGVLGQLADGDDASRSTPAQVATGVARIALGDGHGLFVKTDASLWVAGDNGLGQLGDGTRVSRSTPLQIAAGVAQIAAGASHSLFVTAGGTLQACGLNTYGQIGNGERDLLLVPSLASSEAVAVTAGDQHTLFIKADRTLWAVGENRSGQLGDGTTINRIVPVQIASDVIGVVAGASSTFFIKTDGTLWAMGKNHVGQLGLGVTATTVSQPGLVAAGVRQVATSGSHTLFVKTDDTLWAMGSNIAGQFGNLEASAGSNVPVQVASQVMQVAAGSGGILSTTLGLTYGFSAYLKTDGTLWTMGHNSFGQLGDGSSALSAATQPVPRRIATDVASVSAGQTQLLFVKRNGALWGAGWSSFGALGTGTSNTYRSPVQIMTQVARVATGTHTLILKLDGSLWATGNNVYGQLGDGGMTTRLSPVKIADGILDIAVGGSCSLFLQTPKPEILLPPAPLAVRVGARAEFVVTTAEGGGPLTYQWRREGVALSSLTAQSARLVIESVLMSDAGGYDVVVTGAGGQTTSERASLVVHTEEHSAYAAWAAANAITGDALADPESGDAPNLLRYAFDLPAHGPVQSPTAVQTVNDTDGAHLAVAFTRKTYAPGLRYVVESSADLVNWSTVSTTLPGLPETVVVRDSLPLTATQRRFLRVRAEMTP